MEKYKCMGHDECGANTRETIFILAVAVVNTFRNFLVLLERLDTSHSFPPAELISCMES